jgi:hypothetical protein
VLRPPVGVAILGFFALIAGIAYIVLGLRLTGWVVFGPGDIGDGTFLWGLLTLGGGIAFAAAAFAFWSVQPWAWMFGIILAGLGLIDAFFLWLGTNDLSTGLAAAFFPLIVLWYLNSKDVKGAFGIETTA